jgi:phosphoribosyl 1,2-cyclic phosphodiesterase
MYIGSQQANIIVDAGVNLLLIEKSLKLFGTNASKLDGVLISHVHSDHTCGVAALCKKYSVPVFCHQAIADFMSKHSDGQIVEFFDDSFYLKDLTITPFKVEHDVHCVGFAVISNTKQVSIATDMGQATQGAIDAMQGSDLCFVESNHDVQLVQQGSYPEFLKKRILSKKGHLSNNACGDLIQSLVNFGTKNFVLSHLSESNNYPELAFSSVVNKLQEKGIKEGQDVHLEVAMQNRLSSLYQL